MNARNSAANNLRVVQSRPVICRYFIRGICRFGTECRFRHDLNEIIDDTNRSGLDLTRSPHLVAVEAAFSGVSSSNHVLFPTTPGSVNKPCPYRQPCSFGTNCYFAIHFELCTICNKYCLHPTNMAQHNKHKKQCQEKREKDLGLSAAIERSKDKTCCVCFENVLEKPGLEKRFGILSNCSHVFCLECIRKWRQGKTYEYKVKKACPLCRVCSDFVCPSAFWVDTQEEKDQLLDRYRKALSLKDCRHFNFGSGKCPFGNQCFYKHALINGILVDVGPPNPPNPPPRSSEEMITILQNFLMGHTDGSELQFTDPIFFPAYEDDSYDGFY